MLKLKIELISLAITMIDVVIMINVMVMGSVID
jgi:hypothetical protein